MIGGIFFEHGHRMIATAVGFLTIVLVVLVMKREGRPWVRKMAWLALGLVILQGLLGGLTVLLLLPKLVSISHGCLAQTYFSLVVSLAVWTSSFWHSNPPPRTELAGHTPLHRLALALFGLSYVQLILGAILRHSGRALPFHIIGALLVAGFALWIFRRVWKQHREITWLKRLATLIVTVLLIQIALGISSFFLLRHHFETIPPPFWVPVTITFHVATGALLLGLSVLLALTTYHTRPHGTPSIRSMFSDYLTLTKPGISFTAAITAFAGFLLGSQNNFSYLKLFHTCVGTLMAAAGAGCLNMLIEKDVDSKMNRTRERPLPAGRMYKGEVLFLGTFFWLAGVLYLGWAVNFITAFIAGLTVSIYLYLYTPLKKISSICIAIGAVAGALPPVMGWTAATGQISIEPIALFGILFFWQFPHFLSLAWMYKDDYRLAGLHMLPSWGADGQATARSILGNSIALLAISLVPHFLGLTGPVYLVSALVLGIFMTFLSFRFFQNNGRQEAKHVFLFSLAYIPLLTLFMVLSGSTL
jgi:protoheme IX farnesyltransferase